MNSTTQTRVALAGVAATLLAGMTLFPLVRGVDWYIAVFVVVAVTAGSGAATRQATRFAPAVVAVQLATFVVTVTALFVRDSALWGFLPGPEAIQSLHNLLMDGLRITHDDGPPVPAERGLILLTAGGVGLVGLIVDIIAVSLRRPAAAGLPLLAVYCVPAAVLRGGLAWPFFVIAGAGYLILVGADSADRIRNWGRVLGAQGPDGEVRSLGGPLSGARRVGFGALAVAVIVPSLIPGLGERLMGTTGGDGVGGGNGRSIQVVNPMLDLRNDLTKNSNVIVIRYTTTVVAPEPLRIVTEDQFDGEKWAPNVGAVPRDQRVQNGLATPPGLSATTATTAQHTDISVVNLRQTYLPLPYPTQKVDIKGSWLWDARTLNVVGDNVTTLGVTYKVDHMTVTPTAAQLKNASVAPTSVLDAYTVLPPGLSPKVKAQAKLVAGTGSAYLRAVRLQNWFRSTGGFTYSMTAPGNGTNDGGSDTILAFIQQKHGYCVHFASAMAVMARTLGIPARVAVGFLPGTRNKKTGKWEISLQDAHAWPELYFEGTGWVRFEPTPAARTGQAPAWSLPTAADAGDTAAAQATAVPTPSAAAQPVAPKDQGTGAQTERPMVMQILGAVPWRVVGVILLLLMFLGVPIGSASVARRLRWRRAKTATERAEAAWDELNERLGDLGVRWASSWTPRAVQHRLINDHSPDEPARDALGRLVADIEDARYAPPHAEGRATAELAADVHAVAVGVAATVDPRSRRRARWFPKSGLTALSQAGRRSDELTDETGQTASDLGTEIDVRGTVGSRR